MGLVYKEKYCDKKKNLDITLYHLMAKREKCIQSCGKKNKKFGFKRVLCEFHLFSFAIFKNSLNCAWVILNHRVSVKIFPLLQETFSVLYFSVLKHFSCSYRFVTLSPNKRVNTKPKHILCWSPDVNKIDLNPKLPDFILNHQ